MLASGSDDTPAGWLKLGHFAAMRWQANEGLLPEVFIGGEGLAAGPTAVLGTLLHEAAHALADVRDMKDTSRQAATTTSSTPTSRTLGLDVAQVKPIGWSATSVSADAAVEYADTIADLAAALTIFRHSEAGPLPAAPTTTPARAATPPGPVAALGDQAQVLDDQARVTVATGWAASACGRRIRVAPSVLAAGDITCGLCGSAFRATG